ncbi:hypothetical protein PG991_013380 [Apiospora marii]|uniref:Protein kinase domain-containing protein n=1 Tax=Apiospora marii TaxID=335849 RepID=A0ABR1R666_9PEZI
MALPLRNPQYPEHARRYEAASQEFRILRDLCTRTTHDHRKFVLVDKLTSRLREKPGNGYDSHLQCLLLHSALSCGTKPPVLNLEQLEKYIRIFYILIDLGYPQLITLFSEKGLNDSRLPLNLASIREIELGDNANIEGNFHSQFLEKQYFWCPMVFDSDEGQIRGDQIIPICTREKIDTQRGPNALSHSGASLWRIEVPEECVASRVQENIQEAKVERRISLDNGSDINVRYYQFALKQFSKDDSDKFFKEKDIANCLKNVDGIVRYFTWYQEGDEETSSSRVSLNLVLELCEMDLYTAIRKRSPPVLPSEIKGVWESMLDIACASPEKNRPRRGSSQDPAPRGHAEEDIWSLGCVFSVVATWVVLGADGVTQYGKVRQKAQKRRTGIANDNFHDDQQVLPEVKAWHRYLRVASRRTDTITSKVLDLVDNYMLVGADIRRTAAFIVKGFAEHLSPETGSDAGFPDEIRYLLLKIEQEEVDRERQGSFSEDLLTGYDIAANGGAVGYADSDSASARELLLRHTMPTVQRLPQRNLRSLETDCGSARSEGVGPDEELSITPMPSLQLDYSFCSECDAPVSIFTMEQEIDNLQGGLWSRLTRRTKSIRERKQAANNDELKNFFDNRDIHWKQVMYWATVLLKRVMDYDDDGVEMYFSQGDRKNQVKQKRRQKIAEFEKAMRSATPDPNSNPLGYSLPFALQYIFMESSQKSDTKHQTIFVFTDGIWEGGNEAGVESVIKSHMKKMGWFNSEVVEQVQEQKPLSIEFIRFGHDPNGTERLRRLDDDLVKEGYPVDDACNLRLVNKAWAAVAGAYILPEVTFQYHEKDLARLRSIAAHPLLSRHVKSLGYIAKRYETTPISYAEFVSDVKSNNMIKKLDSKAFAHLPPIVPTKDLPQHYELYKQTVAAQKVLEESQADALCLELVLPRLTNLQQITMSTGSQYYQGFTKNKDFCDSGCIRQPHFEGDPVGIGLLEVLLNAVAGHDLSVPGLRAGLVHWRFFEKSPEELSRLFKPFKDGAYIDLSLCIDTDDNFNDVTEDMEKCRASLQSGAVADVLQSMPRLEYFSFSIFPSGRDKRAVSLGQIITPNHHWSSLTTVDLDSVDCEQSELWGFLLLHKDTLRSLCLKEILLTKGSWKTLLPDIRKFLFIEEPCICGNIQDYTENADGSPGPLEEFDLTTPDCAPCDMRSSINCYICRGGELYPDELPLTEEVVDKYFESHVRQPGMESEEEDAAAMREIAIKSYRRREFLDRTEPGWDRLSDSSDDGNYADIYTRETWFGSHHD